MRLMLNETSFMRNSDIYTDVQLIARLKSHYDAFGIWPDIDIGRSPWQHKLAIEQNTEQRRPTKSYVTNERWP